VTPIDMKYLTYTVDVKVRWWILNPYIEVMSILSMMFGIEPDYDKMASFIGKYCISIKPS